LTPEQLSEIIARAVLSLAEKKGYQIQLPEKIVVERPKNREHGDWSTNIAMQLAKQAGTNPREFAQNLVQELADTEGLSRLEIAGPGFLNIFLDTASAASILPEVVGAGASFGAGILTQGRN